MLVARLVIDTVLAVFAVPVTPEQVLAVNATLEPTVIVVLATKTAVA